MRNRSGDHEGQPRARRDAGLLEEVRDVIADGVVADAQAPSDLLVRLAQHDEPDDLGLARRQVDRRPGRARRHAAGRQRESRRRGLG